jgi:hypothetical protein
MATIFCTGAFAFAQAPINRKPIGKPSSDSPIFLKENGGNNGATSTPLPENAVTTAGALCPTTRASVWDNGAYNTVNALGSSDIPNFQTRTADDFVVTAPTIVYIVTADMVCSPGLYTGKLDILPTDASGNGPSNTAPPILSLTSTLYQQIGTQFGSEIRRYTFFVPNVTFQPGRYWVNPYLSGPEGLAFFGTSNGAQPSAGQPGYFRSTQFGFPTWTATNSPSINIGPNFAFSVVGCPLAGNAEEVNDQVSFNVTQQGLSGTTAFVCTLPPRNYQSVPFTINATVTNTGTNTLSNVFYQVIELREATGVAPINPFRFGTASDFNPNNCTGGLVGSFQPIAPTMNPGDSVPTVLQIFLPQLRRFRFVVTVGATITPAIPSSTGKRGLVTIGKLAIETTGFDKTGRPVVSSTFTPAPDAPATLTVGG